MFKKHCMNISMFLTSVILRSGSLMVCQSLAHKIFGEPCDREVL